MALFKYEGQDAIEVPGFGRIEQGDTVDFPADVVGGLNSELWSKSTKKAAKAVMDSPAGEEE